MWECIGLVYGFCENLYKNCNFIGVCISSPDQQHSASQEGICSVELHNVQFFSSFTRTVLVTQL
jgi:hypothetical protein